MRANSILLYTVYIDTSACVLRHTYVCSMIVISGEGMYLHACESNLSSSTGLKAYVWAFAFSSFIDLLKSMHSMLVLNRPAVKKIAEHSCEMVSLTFNDLI